MAPGGETVSPLNITVWRNFPLRRRLAAATGLDVSPEAVGRAIELCKADLVTEMVGEFPELQGCMGAYYARHDGEPDNDGPEDRFGF